MKLAILAIAAALLAAACSHKAPPAPNPPVYVTPSK